MTTVNPIFEHMINNDKILEIKAKVAEISKILDDKEKSDKFDKITADIQTDFNVGFPSEQWCSDHIPVGAVFDWP